MMAANLSGVEAIELAIGSLSPQELEELYDWLDRHHPQLIDERLPADLVSGRLDHAILRALEDEKNKPSRSL